MPCRSSSNKSMNTRSTKDTRALVSFVLLVFMPLLLGACTQQMADQPRYDPLQYSEFFPNGSSARPLPDGVIPHDYVGGDEWRDTGMVNGKPAERFPFPIDKTFVERGRQ